MPGFGARRAAVVLAGMVVVSAGLRFWGSLGFQRPWITPDETVYALLGRSLWQDGALEILGAPAPYFSLFYPALAGAPLTIDDLARALDVLAALQALVVSSAAFVVYAWGRGFLSEGLALAAAAVVLTPPLLAYSGFVMTESLAYPVGVLALAAIAGALREPTLVRQGLAVAAITAAVAVRLQFLVLVPVVVSAAVLAAVLARDGSVLRRLVPALGSFGLVAAGSVIWAAAGGSWRVFGGYEAVAEDPLGGRPLLPELAWHAAAVNLLVLGVPLLSTAVLLCSALSRGESDPRARAFLAVTGAYVPLLVLQVALFAARYVDHVAERYLIGVVPPLVLGLALWVARGTPRPRLLTAAVGGGAVALALAFPVRELIAASAAQDAFSGLALTRLGNEARTVWLIAALGSTALFLIVPRAAGFASMVAVGAGLAVFSVLATRELAGVTAEARHRTYAGADSTWIDAAAHAPVALFYTGERFWPSIWFDVFWNRRVAEVLRIPDAEVPGPLPQTVVYPRFDGLLFTFAGLRVEGRLLAAPSTITLAGEPIARLVQVDVQPGLTLWKADLPVRLLSWVRGTSPVGDFAGAVQVSVFACGPGRLELTLLGKEGLPVVVRRDGEEVARLEIPAGAVWNGAVPGPRDATRRSRCVYELESAGLVGSTRIEYVRR